jgi:hypothetical protein
MFFSGAIFPIFLLISLAENEPGAILVPFVVFFISLVWMLLTARFKRQLWERRRSALHYLPQPRLPSLTPAANECVRTNWPSRRVSPSILRGC